MTRAEVTVPDNAPDPQANRATRRAAGPRVTIRQVPTRRLVRACSDCYEIDHPAQTCQSAAAERAALRRLLDDATSRIVRDWDDGYGNPGPAFTSR